MSADMVGLLQDTSSARAPSQQGTHTMYKRCYGLTCPVPTQKRVKPQYSQVLQDGMLCWTTANKGAVAAAATQLSKGVYNIRSSKGRGPL